MFGKSLKWRFFLVLVVAALAGLQPAFASEVDAVAISQNIQAVHMPHGTILDPIFASADPAAWDYNQIVSYTRAADSAIWTGHYLAAEAFRYSVTGSFEAWANARRALAGIQSLLDVTGYDLLARCLLPVDSPYVSAILTEESGHGAYHNEQSGFFWIGNTSRDQYAGVMFGLGVAYDMMNDEETRGIIRTTVGRILNYLLGNNWNVRMPDGRISTTFLHRPDQMLSFLQVGRRVDPGRFGNVYGAYRSYYAWRIGLPISFDNLDDHGSYFKFNLNYITLYNLVRLEAPNSPYRSAYMDAYDRLRRRTEWHGNAHFNMLDRHLNGFNAGHDLETVALLDQWLQRPRRDYWTDLRGQYAACGDDRACSPIPVNDRINTDFLWQRSPFLLFGGGYGTRETAGIDYILPYWMARFHGMVE